jgi:hypothetical protein
MWATGFAGVEVIEFVAGGVTRRRVANGFQLVGQRQRTSAGKDNITAHVGKEDAQ